MWFTDPTHGSDGAEREREWSSGGTNERTARVSTIETTVAGGGGRSRGGDVSSGKKFVAMTLLTFIVIIVLGVMWGHHAPADPTGPSFSNQLANYPTTTTDVRVTQVGVNGIASDIAHLGVSINFTWTLVTGFLVLFMQVGFAFLVTGLTRAKNAGHMMMMNIAAFVVALMAYYAIGFAFM